MVSVSALSQFAISSNPQEISHNCVGIFLSDLQTVNNGLIAAKFTFWWGNFFYQEADKDVELARKFLFKKQDR